METKTIKQLWTESPAHKIEDEEYHKLVQFMSSNHNDIFPDRKDGVFNYFEALNLWDYTIVGARKIVEGKIKKNKEDAEDMKRINRRF